MHLSVGRTYCIMKICDEKKDRFKGMGLVQNTHVKIKHIQWLNGPIVIEVDGRLIALRRNEIECLKLQ